MVAVNRCSNGVEKDHTTGGPHSGKQSSKAFSLQELIHKTPSVCLRPLKTQYHPALKRIYSLSPSACVPHRVLSEMDMAVWNNSAARGGHWKSCWLKYFVSSGVTAVKVNFCICVLNSAFCWCASAVGFLCEHGIEGEARFEDSDGRLKTLVIRLSTPTCPYTLKVCKLFWTHFANHSEDESAFSVTP